MKKFLFPLLAIATLFLATSCEKTHLYTSYYTVHSDQWEPQYTDNTRTTVDYYFSKWENINITPSVIDQGAVLVYLCSNSGCDELLPYTTYRLDNSTGALWSERLEFDIEQGYIYFVLKASDFHADQTIQSLDSPLKFKVVVMDED